MTKCISCGKELMTGDGLGHECWDCKNKKESQKQSNAGLAGWICPVCGRGLSPYTSVCPCVQSTIKFI